MFLELGDTLDLLVEGVDLNLVDHRADLFAVGQPGRPRVPDSSPATYPAVMAFTFPSDLPPELYPLAWLVGSWRGYGILTYGDTVPEQAVYQEMTFTHDGGPYLIQHTTLWTLDATRSENLDFDTPGLEGAERITPAQIWSTETTYWRPVGQEQPEADDADTQTPITRLELVSADPAGHVGVWEGWIQGPRAQVGTQAVGRTRTAAEVTQMNRMFGLVAGDLMWTQDMAAFGQTQMQSYASGRLGRIEKVEDSDDAALGSVRILTPPQASSSRLDAAAQAGSHGAVPGVVEEN